MNISEVSKIYGISADTLRYYERVGLIPHVPRKPNGIRDYDQASCGWVEFIRCMRSAGLPIEALIEYVTLYQKGEATWEARKQILIEQRDRLKEHLEKIQTTLARLNYKIEHYDLVSHNAEQMIEGEKE